MQLPSETVTEVRNRLRRAAGQLHAVERMLEEGRDCRELVTQLSAARGALDQARMRLVASSLTYCLEQPDRARSEGYDLDEVERMFMRLA